MSVFVVQHQHSAEGCPAGDAQMGPMLLQHLSDESAAKFGIKVRGDAVLNGLHHLFLILEAESEGKVQEFMTPFAQMGSVEVLDANSCTTVVGRGHC